MGRVLGTAAAAATGYLVGTLPSADIVTRLATGGRLNIRQEGTGNPGAANVAGVLGKKWGAAVLAADVGKGMLAARLGGRIAGRPGLHAGGPGSVVGHCYPVWDGFDGGKGVATSGGQVLATFPYYFPIDFAVGFVTSRLPFFERKAYAATELASATWIACSLLWWHKRWPTGGWGPEPSVGLPLAALATSAAIRARFMQTNARVDAWRETNGGEPENGRPDPAGRVEPLAGFTSR